MRHVLVDGHNLLLRAANVPALAKLRDRRGQPTGVLHGFVRSVLALRAHDDAAKVTVLWDGSPRRRVAQYAGYKANRPVGHGGVDPDVAWLREVLPLLDVAQAWNAEEEADDVAATLVARLADDDDAVIVSTDRDLLQLASTRVRVLVPAPKATSGKGTLCGPDEVEAIYETRPDALVLLRAFVGDASDCLPGVHGVGQKIAAKVWRALAPALAARDPKGNRRDEDLRALDQAIDLLRTGVEGPTKLQCHRILQAEAIVRRNVALMTLVNDLDVHVVPARRDDQEADRRLMARDLLVVRSKVAAITKTPKRISRQTAFLAA